jgi:oligopeptide/dipeptide ABC transporter ATP-binding protein
VSAAAVADRRLGAAPPLLRVDGLTVAYPGPGGKPAPVVCDLSFDLRRGEMTGLVGESGCGKTVTALALMRLVEPPGRVTAGHVRLDGEDLLALGESAMRRRRGGRLAMVFQEPATALNPVFTIGWQVAEAVRAHRAVSRAEARSEAVRLLERVALPAAGSRVGDYPHQLSGGQRQRVMIAMALAGGPDLLLADEPTTALDVTVQAEILDLLARLRAELGLAVLLITHDLAVVAGRCDRVLVMYAGRLVEEAAAEELFRRPAHPYSAALLAALPRLGRRVPRGELAAIPGRVPAPGRLPAGCAFHPRCGDVMEVCRRREPPLFTLASGARARCFLHGGDGEAAG